MRDRLKGPEERRWVNGRAQAFSAFDDAIVMLGDVRGAASPPRRKKPALVLAHSHSSVSLAPFLDGTYLTQTG